MDSFTVRMGLRLAYLTAVFAGGGYFYASLYSMEGVLVLGPGKAERTVAAPAGSGALARMMQPALPPELLEANNPRVYERALDKNEHFTTARLPFAVTLEAVEVLEQPPARLVLERQDKALGPRLEIAAEPGAEVPWGAGHARLREVRPWLGLLRTPNGAPMAAVSLRRGEEAWTRGVFLADGLWRDVEGETGLLLRWWSNEKDARERFPDPLGPLFGARWGAAHGDTLQWFDSLAPGTGATLPDDTEVTLIRAETDHEGAPAILVSRKPKSGPEEQTWHRADDAEGPIRLELPGRFQRHVLLNAWRDGGAFAAVYTEGKRGPVRALKEGEAIPEAEGPGFSLRLDSAMRTGTPSTAAEGPAVMEAVLETPAGELALREGGMLALEDGAQIRFRKVTPPPRVRYTLTIGGEDGPRTETLELGQRLHIGNWRLRYMRPTNTHAQIAVLEARRTAFTPGSLMGMLLLAAGCYGFVIVRALARRDAQSSSSLSFAPLPPASPEGTAATDKDES